MPNYIIFRRSAAEIWGGGWNPPPPPRLWDGVKRPGFFRVKLFIEMNNEYKCPLRPYLTGLETRWRLESPLVAETSQRRLLETSRVSGESREIQTCLIFFFGDFFSLQQVSETSPRRESASHVLVSRVAATDQCQQSQRRLLGESASHFWSPESPELPQLISRGDVSASEIGPLTRRFSWNTNLHKTWCVSI